MPKVDVIKAITIHAVTLRRNQGWIHTHGMTKYGKPELEIRGLPAFLYPVVASLLNQTCDYILNSGREVHLGESMQVGNLKFQFIEAVPGTPDEYTGHYDVTRWCLSDPEQAPCDLYWTHNPGSESDPSVN